MATTDQTLDTAEVRKECAAEYRRRAPDVEERLTMLEGGLAALHELIAAADADNEGIPTDAARFVHQALSDQVDALCITLHEADADVFSLLCPMRYREVPGE